MVKLNQNTCSYIGHMTIPIVMKKLYERQESGPRRFLLAHISEISWISCVNSGNFLKISGIVPSLYRKRFPPWANEKKPYGARKKCSGQNKGLIQAQNRKITMTYSENRKFFHSVGEGWRGPITPSAPPTVQRVRHTGGHLNSKRID